MHGKLAKKLPSENPTITEEEALRIALATVKAEKYIWEDPQWEQQIKQDLQDDKATYYPKGQLMYARLKPIDDFTSVNFALVYKFEINSLLPSRKQEEVMVDAKTSKVVRKRDMRHEAWGTVNTLYDGTLGFVTKWRGFPNYDYILKDHDRGDKLHTLKWSATTPWWQRSEVDDKDNVLDNC